MLSSFVSFEINQTVNYLRPNAKSKTTPSKNTTRSTNLSQLSCGNKGNKGNEGSKGSKGNKVNEDNYKYLYLPLITHSYLQLPVNIDN